MFTKKIALDKDILVYLAQNPGEHVYCRTDTSKYAKGDILGVKETWRLIYGEPEYMLEMYKPMIDKYGFSPEASSNNISLDPGGGWRYSNQMPEEFIKRTVVVKNVQEMPRAQFMLSDICGREIYYNRMSFAPQKGLFPFHRWFRPGWKPTAVKDIVYVATLAVNDAESAAWAIGIPRIPKGGKIISFEAKKKEREKVAMFV